MRPYGSLWFLIDPYKLYRVFMGGLVSLLVLTRLYVSLSVLIGLYVSLCVPMCPYKFLCVLMRPDGS